MILYNALIKGAHLAEEVKVKGLQLHGRSLVDLILERRSLLGVVLAIRVLQDWQVIRLIP